MEDIKNKTYTDDGCLIVSELDECPYFEEDAPRIRLGCKKDCFFCKFSDFRKREYIAQVETESRRGVLYSVCHNDKNKKTAM